MKNITKNDIYKALEFCGGLDGFNNLMKSYNNYLSIGVCDFSDSWDHLSNVSIKDKRFAIINKVIPTNRPTGYDYLDVCINEERHTLYLSRENVIKLLNDVAKSNDSYEEALSRCTEIPCYLSVNYGFVEDFVLIDRSQYNYALLLMELSYLENDNGKYLINILALKNR